MHCVTKAETDQKDKKKIYEWKLNAIPWCCCWLKKKKSHHIAVKRIALQLILQVSSEVVILHNARLEDVTKNKKTNFYDKKWTKTSKVHSHKSFAFRSGICTDFLLNNIASGVFFSLFRCKLFLAVELFTFSYCAALKFAAFPFTFSWNSKLIS